MTILKSQVFGRSLIGVYLSGNNSRIFYPPTILKPTLKKIRTTFDEPSCPLTINNSTLLGVYMVSNKSGVIVPDLMRDDELSLLNSAINGEMNVGVGRPYRDLTAHLRGLAEQGKYDELKATLIQVDERSGDISDVKLPDKLQKLLFFRILRRVLSCFVPELLDLIIFSKLLIQQRQSRAEQHQVGV